MEVDRGRGVQHNCAVEYKVLKTKILQDTYKVN